MNQATCLGGSMQETILLVEDEKAILTLAVSLLKHLGYTVLPAATPSEALRIAQESPKIDLVLTDLVMPEINGWDLAERLKALKPGLRVLYMSGYPSEVISRQVRPGTAFHFIQKPFSLNSLASTIRKVLRAETEGTGIL
jgi:CheY-like chemotaxis protein